MVFEDMQWADAGLLDFVEYLLEWSRGSPILMVTLARPELQSAAQAGGRESVASPRSISILCRRCDAQLLAGMAPGFRTS